MFFGVKHSIRYLEKFHDLADLAAIWISVRTTPQIEKNKLLLNEYLGYFRHYYTMFFLFFYEK